MRLEVALLLLLKMIINHHFNSSTDRNTGAAPVLRLRREFPDLEPGCCSGLIILPWEERRCSIQADGEHTSCPWALWLDWQAGGQVSL